MQRRGLVVILPKVVKAALKSNPFSVYSLAWIFSLEMDNLFVRNLPDLSDESDVYRIP